MEIQETDVLIIGRGFAGGVLACGLNKKNINTICLDKNEVQQYDNKYYAINYNSKAFLKTLNIKIADQDAHPIKNIRISTTSRLNNLYLPSEYIGHELGYMIPSAKLLQTIDKQIEQHNIPCINGKIVDTLKLKSDHYLVTLNDNSIIKTKLIIGADGRTGNTSQLLNMLLELRIDYHHSAIVFNINHEYNHNDCAHQIFLHGPILASLPLHGGYKSSIVWTNPTSQVKKIMQLEQQDFLELFQKSFGNFLGDIAISNFVRSYPIYAHHMHSYISERAVIIGDAAHTMHPVAGQSFNFTLQDIKCLTTLLNKNNLNNKSVLQQYQLERKSHNASMIHVTDQIVRIFSNNNMIIKSALHTGLAILQQIKPLKKKIMRYAMCET